MAIEIYTKQTCMYCQKAKAWFKEHNIPYEEIDVSSVADFGKMKERLPEAKTVPQILIDGHLIGGYDNLMEYEQPILEKLRKMYPEAQA
ncbi:MAG: glutathione S-transferase N-terminal domain-containing protein [Caenispirillum bisanense]|uniref:Glutaredoxin 3 n=1 Tax=Caenispirillum bisanense TaxID=414052 RepID=A0A286GU65_9PROT|nr:glutaredoxin domain-containing protein [Caenispirillum bisanense]MCA1941549.1 glutathione S-transferase N-terminal domain-containing protein [Caenispirillum bisanense]MCA1973167.1 glutathione S-transferase N-terminal domain-containing protein [Caenispirillum sp.]SOD99095.1 glutaredoxin 3 [Caenispirillum bisanense]